MPRFELEDTYLSLDGRGGLARHPVEGFWESVDDNPDLLGTLLGVYVSHKDWPQWEVHPQGDEVLVLLEGKMTMILAEAAGERRVGLTPGATCIVPRGVWHRALVHEASRVLGVTYGAGTQHRPV